MVLGIEIEMEEGEQMIKLRENIEKMIICIDKSIRRYYLERNLLIVQDDKVNVNTNEFYSSLCYCNCNFS